MTPLYVAVIVYFDVSHLVTERSSHRRWSITVPESLHISLIHKAWVDLINAEAATGGVPSKNSILKNLANFTGKHLCWSMELLGITF